MTVAPALDALGSPEAGLGLRAGVVEVVEHNPKWAGFYTAVEEHITTSLHPRTVLVAHIGSTSVPGLAAKPVLDIAIGAQTPIDNQGFITELESAGFSFTADLGVYGGLFFTVSSAPDVAVAHLHLVDRDDFQWRWYLAFRDALRANADLRDEYQSLKLRAANSHAEDRDAYTKAKFDWVLATVSDLDEGTSPG